ncbi:hypothetical protein Ahy_B03g063548 [Arachis hypogaea]|uniref:Mediator of RNA polymerase II transcription subunit 28 n=1 Tax=Arachis hypogaea TaxID=3818 RepID=A0A444ZXP8_ARAHY|nr:hypothetical protein Ahy_B03g063548 [Arachis hypogaea]
MQREVRAKVRTQKSEAHIDPKCKVRTQKETKAVPSRFCCAARRSCRSVESSGKKVESCSAAVLIVDVDRYARDFMEAAKKLQLHFISLQREDKPTKVEMLRKDITLMEEELDRKNELIKKQESLVLEWKKELKEQMDKHKTELERV